MKLKAIVSILFLVLISILSLRTNVTKFGELNTGHAKLWAIQSA
jgi:hypothetical protein